MVKLVNDMNGFNEISERDLRLIDEFAFHADLLALHRAVEGDCSGPGVSRFSREERGTAAMLEAVATELVESGHSAQIPNEILAVARSAAAGTGVASWGKSSDSTSLKANPSEPADSSSIAALRRSLAAEAWIATPSRPNHCETHEAIRPELECANKLRG
jgi:hypothetical protein